MVPLRIKSLKVYQNNVLQKGIHNLNFTFVGKKERIQTIIKEPEIHLLVRCPSTDEQLFYSDVRLEEVCTLSKPISMNNGIEFTDIIRFFKGRVNSNDP